MPLVQTPKHQEHSPLTSGHRTLGFLLVLLAFISKDLSFHPPKSISLSLAEFYPLKKKNKTGSWKGGLQLRALGASAEGLGSVSSIHSGAVIPVTGNWMPSSAPQALHTRDAQPPLHTHAGNTLICIK